ncbi:hypothetical protein Lal_00041197 [Lupinus albus]|nr:hypothetical protein Lal_00041197 [Lupinus albus]
MSYLDDWVLCRIYKKSYGSSNLLRPILVDQEKMLSMETMLPTLTMPYAYQNSKPSLSRTESYGPPVGLFWNETYGSPGSSSSSKRFHCDLDTADENTSFLSLLRPHLFTQMLFFQP